VKRGERKARWMLGRLDAAGIRVQPVRTKEGAWGLDVPPATALSSEQQEVRRDAFLFAIGYPRCFGTMVRIVREREAQPRAPSTPPTPAG